MIAIFSLFVVLTLSLLVTRIATVALSHTGLSRESARFQARSAFTGAGFTTTESEKVVGHPVRRRIILLLMLLGNAGIVSAVSSLILTFVGQEGTGQLVFKVVLLSAGLAVLWGLASSQWVDAKLQKLINLALARFTRLDTTDYASLLHLGGEYGVSELYVGRHEWMAERSLGDLNLGEEGVLVLGIERRDGTFFGVPPDDLVVHSGDNLTVYGRARNLAELSRRPREKGESRHRRAVQKQQVVQAEEKHEDRKVEEASS